MNFQPYSKIIYEKIFNASCLVYSEKYQLESQDFLIKVMSRVKEIKDLIHEGNPVGCLISNHPLDLVNYFAIWLCGGCVIPIHESSSTFTVEQIVKQTELNLILKREKIKGYLPGMESIKNDFFDQGDYFILSTPYRTKKPLLDCSFVIFTSGSTGIPKGVVWSHKALWSKLESINKTLCFTKDLNVYCPLQLHFSFGIWVSLLALLNCKSLYISHKFNPGSFFEIIDTNKIDIFAGVPTMLRAVFKKNSDNNVDFESKVKMCNIRSLLLILGGESMSKELALYIRKEFPSWEIADVYGLTETCTSDFILKPTEFDKYVGSIGFPTEHVKYRICDPITSKCQESEKIGELEIKTPFVMKEYLQNPSLTKESFHNDYFRTGDLAYEREGAVYIVGRKKDLIYKGGNKISPLEIENILGSHPLVSQCVVGSYPDDVMGERIFAMIVLKDKAELNVEDLVLWARNKIDKYKIPDFIYLSKSIPTIGSGKVDRVSVKKQIVKIIKGRDSR